MSEHSPLFDPPELSSLYPHFRLMGSKHRLLPWIGKVLSGLDFDSAADPFCGSGTVSYLLKSMGKEVHSSDFLNFPYHIANGIVANPGLILTEEEKAHLLADNPNVETFITDTFSGIFFDEGDLGFCDNVWANLREEPLERPYKHSLAVAALVRAAVKKQPRGVFTVGNSTAEGYGDGRRDLRLTMREHFLESLELFEGVVFDDGLSHQARRADVFDLPSNYKEVDLVYLDPPYVPRADDNDYIKRYHFLEGLSCYWQGLQIMEDTKVKKIKKRFTPFAYRHSAHDAFDRLFAQFRGCKLVLSYSSNGYPDLDELTEIMGRYKRRVEVAARDHRYHFGTHGEVESSRAEVSEYLIVGED